MTYNVSSGTLNSTIPIPLSIFFSCAGSVKSSYTRLCCCLLLLLFFFNRYFNTSVLSGKVLKKYFVLYFNSLNSFKSMLIFNSKTDCCNSMFTDIQFTLLLTQKLTTDTLFCLHGIIISSALVSEIQRNSLIFLGITITENKGDVSFCEHTVIKYTTYARTDTFCGGDVSCW